MPLTDEELRAALEHDRYPRSSKYDPHFVVESDMGANVLWQTESLTEQLSLVAGQRVLDLGCGNGTSSIFLAREFGVAVYAVDSMIGPGESWRRVEAAGQTDLVVPLRANARSLPFAPRFFDVVISIDAFQYFATDAVFPRELLGLLKPGGQLAFTAPGVTEELLEPPPYFRAMWRGVNFDTLRTPDWWKQHFTRPGSLEVQSCGMLPEGWRDWIHWREILIAAGTKNNAFHTADIQALEGAAGRVDIVRFVGRKHQ